MPKQAEYLGYITASTNALLAIINNILDLATIDAGAMTLNLGLVDILNRVRAGAHGPRRSKIRERRHEHKGKGRPRKRARNPRRKR